MLVSSNFFLRLFPLLLFCDVQQVLLIIFHGNYGTLLYSFVLGNLRIVCLHHVLFRSSSPLFSLEQPRSQISAILSFLWSELWKLWLSNRELTLEFSEKRFSVTSFSRRSEPWIYVDRELNRCCNQFIPKLT